jgi:hypothetical protein
VTLFRDEEEGGGLDLSHLTSVPDARQAVAGATEGPPVDAAARDEQQPAGPEQHDGPTEAALMDVEGPELRPARGAGEQPPANAPPDPLSLLPPEMRQPPEGQCDPAVQARTATD